MKTLITGGKSAQALKLLKAFTGDQVLLGDYGDAPSFSSAQYQFISLGEKNLDTIAHNLLNVCLDQQADRLIPISSFEVEAVAKSAVLFEEFNIHVLLPEMSTLADFISPGVTETQNWAVFENGVLLYSTKPELITSADQYEKLSGVFYSNPASAQKLTLFTIA